MYTNDVPIPDPVFDLTDNGDKKESKKIKVECISMVDSNDGKSILKSVYNDCPIEIEMNVGKI